MKKVLGIFGLLVFVCLFTTILNPDFITTYNIQNTLRWTSLFGILSIGVAFVIITGGIDLSIGSLVGLVGCLLPMCLRAASSRPPGEAINMTLRGSGWTAAVLGAVWLAALVWKQVGQTTKNGADVQASDSAAGRWGESRLPIVLFVGGLAVVVLGYLLPPLTIPAWATIALVVLWMLEIAVVIGLFHGLLITKVKLQPFVVTLCGLLYYRGMARWLADDQTQGFGTGYEGLKSLAVGRPCTMAMLLLVSGVAIMLGAAWRIVRRGDGDQPLIDPRSVLLIGSVLACVCGLQWMQDIPALNTLERQGTAVATNTQWASFWIGLSGTILGTVGLTIASCRQQKWRAIVALLAVACGLALLAVVINRNAAGSWIWEFEQSVADDIFLTTIDFSAGRIPLTVAGLIASVGGATWFLLIAWRGAGLRMRTAVFLTSTALVFLLAGMTPIDRVAVPAPFLILTALALFAGFFLNSTIYGRYLLALGRNEEAARYSGINTDAMVILAYVICSLLAGVAGVLFALDLNSVQPSGHGNFYELYAIAAAVLGGCSLRGGQGSILGVVIGAAVMRVLYNAINILGIKTQLEFTIIGVVILIGVVVDEIFKRIAERRARQRAA